MRTTAPLLWLTQHMCTPYCGVNQLLSPPPSPHLVPQVNAAKQRISEHKARVEQRRLARSMAALMRQRQGGADGQAEADDEARARREEEQAKGLIEQVNAVHAYRVWDVLAYLVLQKTCMAGIEHESWLNFPAACVRERCLLSLWLAALLLQEKAVYHEAYSQLKGVKAEIDGMQAALEHTRVRLQRDFQAWYAAMAGSRSGAPVAAPGAPAVTQAQQPTQGQAWAASAGGGQHVMHPGSGAGSRDGFPAESSQGQRGGSSAVVATRGQPQSPQSTLPDPHATGPPTQRQKARQAQLQAPHPVQQQPQPAEQHEDLPADPYAGVDAEVLAAAKPLLTGNPQADADIIRFYQARAALLKGMR